MFWDYRFKLSRHMKIMSPIGALKFLSYQQFVKLIPQEVVDVEFPSYYEDKFVEYNTCNIQNPDKQPEEAVYWRYKVEIRSIYEKTLYSWIREQVRDLTIVEDRSEIDMEFLQEITLGLMRDYYASDVSLIRLNTGLWMIASPENFKIFKTKDCLHGALVNLRPGASKIFYIKRKKK